MRLDRLSDVLEFVEVRSVVSGGSVATGRWRTSSTIDDDLKFIAVVQGGARLQTDGVPGVAMLGQGDVAVLNGRKRLTLEGGRGDGEPVEVPPPAEGALPARDRMDADADAVIGGRVEVDPVGRELMLRAIPPLVVARAGSASGARLGEHVRRIFDELGTDRVGAEFALRHHGQLLILEIVRALSSAPELPAGWLSLLTDAALRPAVALMHEHPGRGWRLDELARAAAMSRTTFAERFRRAAGVPPLAYLHEWRMLLAQRALRTTDVPVRVLAGEVGYRSESAFSTAFTRHVGESPMRFRRRLRFT